MSWLQDTLLVGSIGLAAILFGAPDPRDFQIVLIAVAMLCIVTLVRCCLTPDARLRWSWTWVPVIGFLGLCLFQMFEWSPSRLKQIAPGSARWRGELLADLGGLNQLSPITLNRAATVNDLRIVLLATTILLVVRASYQDAVRITRLSGLLAAMGGLIGLMALFQVVSGSRSLYLGVSSVHPNSGPFMNHSHFAQFMNLTAGFAVAYLMTRTAKNLGLRFSAQDLVKWLRKKSTRWTLSAAALIFLIAFVSVPLSMSRGGTLSLVVACAIGFGIFSWRSGSDDQSALVVALIGIGAILLTIFGIGPVIDRLQTMNHLESASGGRFEILKDLTPAWREFAPFGSGLGSFEVVFPIYESAVVSARTTHAENEYAQILLETGPVGLAFVLTFAGLVLVRAGKVLWRPSRSGHFAGYGLLIGLVAVMMHSFTDFGQHLPAVAMMTAVTIGLLLNAADIPARDRKAQAQPVTELTPAALRRAQWMTRLTVAGSLLIIATLAFQITPSRQAYAAFQSGKTIQDRYLATNTASGGQPADRAALQEQFDAATEYALDHPTYALHRDRHRWMALGFNDEGKYEDVATDPEVRTQLETLLEDVREHRRAFPTYGPLTVLEGEIVFWGLGLEEGLALIHQGADMLKGDVESMRSAASARIALGQFPEAIATLEAMIAINDGTRSTAIRIASLDLEDHELAYRWASVGPRYLLQLERIIANRDDVPAAMKERVAVKLRDQLETTVANGEADASSLVHLAGYYHADGDLETAIDLYRKAIVQNYQQVDWRFTLAQYLDEAGDEAEALSEARICLRLRPQHRAAEALVNDLLSRRPDPLP